MYAALLAWVVVPTTGEMVVLENKEHFSAWHRFLLLCCLPALCSTVGLIFIPESPRYLVEAGRDVEAMMVYQVPCLSASPFIESTLFLRKINVFLQKIYKKNNTRKGATGAQYQLSELELPTKRPRGLAPPSPTNHTSVLADILYSIEMVRARVPCTLYPKINTDVFSEFSVLEFLSGAIYIATFARDGSPYNYLVYRIIWVRASAK